MKFVRYVVRLLTYKVWTFGSNPYHRFSRELFLLAHPVVTDSDAEIMSRLQKNIKCLSEFMVATFVWESVRSKQSEQSWIRRWVCRRHSAISKLAYKMSHFTQQTTRLRNTSQRCMYKHWTRLYNIVVLDFKVYKKTRLSFANNYYLSII